ncbi:hypothetical protein [Streptomyces iranensis]|uniref:Uncharacterized protein n=1 Tax=Streptomyces iranensis TaxID=576784 RepID=A0A060ZNK2_9ACTN|nr:hypothetical protein [Streptomyces iranensis]MBP2062130.1 hypothetical protein [Streptomyces iranensis]CDR07680.1 predicted protein [Streptomyces iranensis]
MLANLAAIGIKRKKPGASSGYVARRLQALRTDLGSLARDVRVAELDAEIKALSVN